MPRLGGASAWQTDTHSQKSALPPQIKYLRVRARARASWRRRQEIQLYIPERSRSWPGDRKALFTARITIREEVLGGGREV